MNAEEKITAKDKNLLRDMVLGSAASSIACVFSNPLEVLKTRLQLQGELMNLSAEVKTRKYNGMLDAFVKVAREEGVRGLQGGLSAGMWYQSIMNGVRLGSYDYINNHLRKLDAHDNYSFLKNMAIAASVGAAGSYIGNPFFLVKVRLQTANRNFMEGSNSKAVGIQYNYRGVFDGIRQIYIAEGLRGLWRGSVAASTRLAVGSGVQISCYDSIKRYNSEKFGLQGSLLHFSSSACSALGVSICMNPFDVVTTRMYNNASLYSGAVDCARKILKSEGVRGFFKGILPHYVRLAPHTILTFVLWEQFKAIFKK